MHTVNIFDRLFTKTLTKLINQTSVKIDLNQTSHKEKPIQTKPNHWHIVLECIMGTKINKDKTYSCRKLRKYMHILTKSKCGTSLFLN